LVNFSRVNWRSDRRAASRDDDAGKAAHDQKPPGAVEDNRDEGSRALFGDDLADRHDVNGGQQAEGSDQASEDEAPGEPPLVLVRDGVGLVRDLDRLERVAGRKPPVEAVEQLRVFWLVDRPTPTRPETDTTSGKPPSYLNQHCHIQPLYAPCILRFRARRPRMPA
jgi:hypothetical protein